MNYETRARQLNTTRIRAWEQAKALLDDVAAAGRDMTAEERQTWDRLNIEIDDIDMQVRDLDTRERRERESAAIREANAHIFGTSTRSPRDEYSELRSFLRGEAGNTYTVPIAAAARERQLIRQGASPAEVRALAWDTGTAGSIVPTQMARTLYEYLEQSIAMFRAPTTKITTESGGPMQFPRLVAHTIGTQVVAQGTAIGGTDPTFDRLNLDSYKYGALVRVASEVLDDAAFDIASFLGRDIGRAIGRLVDTDLVVGSGTGKPRGLMVAAAGNGSGSVTTGGTAIGITYDTLVDAVYRLADEYRGPSTGWLMRDSTAAVVRKLRDGAGGTIGAVLWEPSLTNGIAGGQPDRLLGYPVFTDPNVAAQGSNARTVAFADMSAYYIRQVGDVVLEIDRSRFFDSDEVAVRGKLRVDGDLIDNAAVTTILQNV
jgi:HK97 family phage major capsid protein